MQNKPIVLQCLEHLRNRVMFEVDIPRYFCLDLIQTRADDEPHKKTGTPSKKYAKLEPTQRLKLTENERLYDQLLSKFVFQLELKEDLAANEVAQMFIHYGDVTIVKSSPFTYWVDFESQDIELQADRKVALNKILQIVRQKHSSLIIDIREYTEALRFPDSLTQISNRGEEPKSELAPLSKPTLVQQGPTKRTRRF